MSGGIGEALQRSASSFTAAHTDLSKAIALVTTSNTVIQNPEIVGTAFKSMSARLRGATTELEEMGETEEGVADTTAKLRDLVKGLTGFDIMEGDKQTFKDIYDIMVGIGEQWDNLTDVEQASLSEALFGKRNSNVGFSVLQNIDTLKSVYKTSEESQGSALKEQERYNESIQAHINQAKASLEELLYTAIDSGLIKDALDMGKGFLDILTEIIDDFGLLKTLIPIVLGALNIKGNNVFSNITEKVLSGNIRPSDVEVNFSDTMESFISKAQNNPTKSGVEILAMMGKEADGLSDMEKRIAEGAEAGSISMDSMTEAMKRSGSAMGTLKNVAGTLISSLKSLAVGFGIGVAIDLAIAGLTKLFDIMTITAEEAKDMSEQFDKITSSIYDNQAENTKKVSKLNSEFQKLQSGVNDSGNNVSLSADQYDRYKEIVGELSDIMPNLSTHFNSQGEAIGFTTGKISDLTKEYQKYIQTQSQLALVEKSEDGHYLYEGVLENYKNGLWSETQDIFGNSVFRFLAGFGSGIGKDEYDKLIEQRLPNKDEIEKYLKQVQTMTEDELNKQMENYNNRFDLSEALGLSMDEIEDILDENGGYNKIQNLINNKRETIEAELEANSAQIRNLMETYLKSTDSFWNMEEKQRENVSSFLSGLDAKTLAKLNITDYKGLSEFSNDVIKGFTDANSSLNKAYESLTTMDKSKMSVEEYQKNLDKYSKDIQNALGIDETKAMGIIVKITGVDTESIEENKSAIEKRFGSLNVQGDYKNWINNLSIGDLEVVNTENFIKELNKLEELSGDGAISFNELNAALFNVKNSAQEAKSSLENLSDINKKRDSLDSLYDKYEQNGYLEQNDVAKILEENPEYYKYIVKVGDQYKLNQRSYNEWADAVKDQQETIDAMLGGFGFAKEYQDELENITYQSGDQVAKEEIDGLVNSYKQLNEQMLNGGIGGQEYLEALGEQISGINDNLRETNGEFSRTTDYLEQISSIQLAGLGNAMSGISSQYVNGLISTADYLRASKTTLETSRDSLGAIYNAQKTELDNEIDYKVNTEEIKSAENELSGLQKITKGVVDWITKGSEKTGDSAEEAKNNIEEVEDRLKETDKTINQIDAVLPFAQTFEEYNGILKQFKNEEGSIDFNEMINADPSSFDNYFNAITNSWTRFLQTTATGSQELEGVLQNTFHVSADVARSAVEELKNGQVDAFKSTLGTMVDISDLASALTIEAKAQTVYAVNNASSAIGNILGTLADAISNFEYSIEAKGTISFGLETEEVTNPFAFLPGATGQPSTISVPKGITTNGKLTLSGNGGDSVNNLAGALKGAGDYFSREGAAISARANDWDSYSPAGTSDMARPVDRLRNDIDGGSGGGSGSGGGGGGSDAIDNAQEKMDSCTTIDHIETKIKRIEREISRLDKMADRVYIGWQERNNKLGESFSQVGREIQAQTDGFWYYLSKANEVGLDDWHKSLVNNGCTNIETFADDDLKRRIDDYQTWYEKALACADAIEDLKDKQAELMKQQFDNIGSQYDQLITRIEKANSKLEGWITLQETQGHLIANSYYGEEIHNEQKRINQLNEERDRLQAQLNCTVNQGQVGLFSEEWYEMSEAIMDVDLAIQEATNSMAELNKKMRENSWEIFDKKMDWESKVKDESDFIIDALSREKLFNDNGTFNNYGSATVGLRAANYDMAMRKAQDYKKAIQEVEAEMRKEATTNVLLEERKQELISAQQEAIKSAMDEKDSIKDLVKEGYDTLVDYLNKLIDKYKKTLEAQKNLYDYEKNIRNQTKAIADYRKQLMALGGDDSEENKARLQQLQESLREAEEERQDTEYEKWLDDQQVILDDMMEGLEDWIEKKLERVDELMAQQIAAVNDNKTVIRDTINAKTKDLGYTMTTQLQSVVDNMKVSDFHNDFLIRTNSIIGLMNSYDKWFEQMVQISEKQSTDNRGCTSQVNNGVANNGCSSADQDKSWVNMVSKNPQPANNGCSNQQPQNNGCSNQQPQNNGCSNQQPANNGCSNQQPQNNDCTQQNNNGCTQYATGRHDGNKELAWTQENGREAIFRKSDGAILTPLGKGDKVFTNAQTEALWDISKGLVSGVNGVPVSNVSTTIKTGDSNVTFAGDINLVGVENPQQFSEQLRNAINNDEKVKKTLQANTLGVAMGKNSLLGKSIR